MDIVLEDLMRESIKVYKALSDESRLRVLNLIFEKECCVCEVMQALEISQPKASRILGTLYDAGFLKLRKDGLWSLYSLDEERIKGYRSRLIEAVRETMKDTEIAVLDRERLKKAERVSSGCANKLENGKSYQAASV
jgi:ArsR family transcriptional regulator, arsenate/arsenite/antimonite-responsive transcriptional repressor